MKQHIGVKLINAKLMTRQQYNDFRGWPLPVDENGADEGYLVEYIDGGKANTVEYAGYVSWSPKDVFERAYCQADGMTFGLAIEALRAGKRVARAGWNGRGMWLLFVPSASYEVAPGMLDNTEENPASYELSPWLGMKTADGKFVPWLASQSDMLALDWMIV